MKNIQHNLAEDRKLGYLGASRPIFHFFSFSNQEAQQAAFNELPVTVLTLPFSCVQLKGLEQENKHLGQTVSSLRQRCQVGAEARVKDVEKENRVLHESICETTAKLNKMEFERKQLRKLSISLFQVPRCRQPLHTVVLMFVFHLAGKELEVMKEKGERAEELEMQMQKLERENESLQKKVASLGITCEKVWRNWKFCALNCL